MLTKSRTKLDDFKIWCLTKRIFNTTEVKQWGMDNFYTSADVRCREMVRNLFLRAIPDDEAVLRGLVKDGNAHLRWYEIQNG